jgi:ectoine hydroxylase-related dioxygenase (phytanoyl-CoA dioxygenase family)
VAQSSRATPAAIGREFRERGFCALRGLLSGAEVALLRADCSAIQATVRAEELCENDCVLDIEPAARLPEDAAERQDPDAYLAARFAPRGDSGRLSKRPVEGSLRDRQVSRLLLRKLPTVAAASLGTEASHPPRLFNEHFVVKPAAIAGPFRWHTDAAHQLEALVPLLSPAALSAATPSSAPSSPDAAGALDYLSLWIPLDDIHESNGALRLLPREAPQPPNSSWWQAATRETELWLEGEAADPGRGHVVSTQGMWAGDALVFCSRLWHCSHPNSSSSDRRVFYAQYSAGVLGGAQPLALAVRTEPLRGGGMRGGDDGDDADDDDDRSADDEPLRGVSILQLSRRGCSCGGGAREGEEDKSEKQGERVSVGSKRPRRAGSPSER